MSELRLRGWMDQWGGGRVPDAEALAALEAQFSDLAPIAVDAVDTSISADRLARQLDVIERRLDGQPGRVLQFPMQARVSRGPQPLRRWVAMAAACGLVFGLAAGRLLGPTTVPDVRRGGGAWSSAGARGAQPGQPTMEPAVADERLLGEVDAAIARTLHQEFRVLDELTPPVPDRRGPR
jgi:hypothetical protein